MQQSWAYEEERSLGAGGSALCRSWQVPDLAVSAGHMIWGKNDTIVQHDVVAVLPCSYRMDYLKFVEHHRATNADITIGCLPVDYERASDFGLMKIDDEGRIFVSFSAARAPSLMISWQACWVCGPATT